MPQAYVLWIHSVYPEKRGEGDKIKVCFLATSKFFKSKAEKRKHFTTWTFSLFTLNKARIQLNTDLSGAISASLTLLVKALCLSSVFLSDHSQAFQEHHLYTRQMFCRPGTLPCRTVCLGCLFSHPGWAKGDPKMVDVLRPNKSISLWLLSFEPVEKAIQGTDRWRSEHHPLCW